jgi:hypothetical protein
MKILIVVVLVLVLNMFVVGCLDLKQPITYQEATHKIPDAVASNSTSNYKGLTINNWKADIHWIAPNVISVANVKPGDEISTWKSSFDLTNTKNKSIGYKFYQGNPVAIAIYDPEGNTYNISYGKEPPEQAKSWITISQTTIYVPAKTVVEIPVKIMIPATAKIFSTWDFSVLCAKESSVAIPNEAVHFIISMKQ